MVRWHDTRGSVAIWLSLWMSMMLAAGWAADNLAAALIWRQHLASAMAAAAVTVDREIRFTGPTRWTEVTYLTVADTDLRSGQHIILTRFAVRPGGSRRWQVSATGYIWAPRWISSPTPGLLRVSATVGPAFLY